MTDKRDIAINFMQQQKYSEAVPLFLKLIDVNPNDSSLYYMLGQCYRFTNNLSKSVEYLSKATYLNSNEPEFFLALGIAHQLTGDYEQAVSTLEQAIKLEPNLFTAYNSIGLTYRKLGMFHEALDWYSRAADSIIDFITKKVKENPEKCFKDEIINGEKTRVILPYLMEKTLEMLKSDPLYAIIKNNIGVCLIEIGDISSAREQFKESIECTPDGYEYTDPYKHLDDISEQ